MSVLIKGMEMPKNCFGCHLFKLDDRDLWCIANHYAGYCRVLSKYIDENKFVNERHPDCPLIEVPTPHGRLIDADKFEFEMNDKLLVALTGKYGEEEAQKGLHFSFRDCISNIQYQPTVIEAEGET